METPTTQTAVAVARKRTDYLTWEDYFMAMALLAAQRSKDPSTQVGACIVSKEKQIVGMGYNGLPWGCNDDDFPWARSGDHPHELLKTKTPYVCHAELNAILNRNSANTKNCTIYVTLFPCNACAKLIIQSRITKVVYHSDKYHDRDEYKASRLLLSTSGVEYVQYTPTVATITLNLAQEPCICHHNKSSET